MKIRRPFETPKNPKKNPIPKGIKILIIFSLHFFLILVPFWDPSWGHVGHQDGPKTPQDAPKTPQEASREALQEAFLLPEVPRGLPGLPGPVREVDFGGFLMVF